MYLFIYWIIYRCNITFIYFCELEKSCIFANNFGLFTYVNHYNKNQIIITV